MRTAVVTVFGLRDISVFTTHGENLTTEDKFESLELAHAHLTANGWMQSGMLWIESSTVIRPMTFMPKTSQGVIVEGFQWKFWPDINIHVLPLLWLGQGSVWAFYFSLGGSMLDPILRYCVPSFMAAELCVGAWETRNLAQKAAVQFLNYVVENDELRKKIDADFHRELPNDPSGAEHSVADGPAGPTD